MLYEVITGRFVGSAAAQGVVLVGEHDDAPGQGDLIAVQAVGVAGTVPALVMGQGDGLGLV